MFSKVTDRYQLTGDVLDGQLDLVILNVRRTDSGLYCCRVDIDGIFNDKKVVMNLRVVRGGWSEVIHNVFWFKTNHTVCKLEYTDTFLGQSNQSNLKV